MNTFGAFLTCPWILRTYSPIKPKKKIWIPPKKKSETIIVGMPGNTSLSPNNTIAAVKIAPNTPRRETTKPVRRIILAGIRLVETKPFKA
jgi:hypothetical protein